MNNSSTTIQILAAQNNHGCTDYAEAELNTDGRATVTYAQSCSSCWQVGHDADSIFLKVGDVINPDDYVTEDEPL